jgi:hypothetical protein
MNVLKTNYNFHHFCALFQQIFDGATTSSLLLATLCGHQVPMQNTFVSTGPEMTLNFVTDSVSGFFAGYTASYIFF